VIKNCLLLAVSLLGLAMLGCETSSVRDAGRVPSVSDSAFVRGLDALTNSQEGTLVSVSYWNGWQAVFENRSSGTCSAYIWNGVAFNKLQDSVIARGDICSIFSQFEPLDRNYRFASIEYLRAFEATRSWTRADSLVFYFPVPSLLAIRQGGHVRPIWILPFRYSVLTGGLVGVLADTGDVLRSVTLEDLKR